MGRDLDRQRRFPGSAARRNRLEGGSVARSWADRNRSLLRFVSGHEPQRFGCRPDLEVANDRRSSAGRGDGHPLAHVRAAHAVLEHDATGHETDGPEAANLIGHRTAADFLDGRRWFARIVERGARTGLPSRVNTVGRPDFAVGFGWRLPFLCLAVGLVIRPRRQGFRRHGVAAPDGSDTQQVGIETHPVALPEVHDEPARREVSRRQAGILRVPRPGPTRRKESPVRSIRPRG